MTDYAYHIRDVYRGGAYRAGHAAVLLPLFGPTALRDVATALVKLRRCWHGRVVSFRAAGIGAYDDLKMQYARNCPPVGVATDDVNKLPCQRPLVCPFCWVRRVVLPVYQAAESILRKQDLQHPARSLLYVPVDNVFLEFKTSQILLPPRGQTATASFYTDRIETIRQMHALNRRREYEFYRATRGVVLLKFQPGARGLLYTRSGLLLVPAAAAKTALTLEKAQHTVRAYDYLGRNQLASAVGRVCSYPVQMLHKPAEVVWAIVRALYKLRTFSIVGMPKGWRQLGAVADAEELERAAALLRRAGWLVEAPPPLMGDERHADSED